MMSNTDKVIEHLSKEISTHMETLMTFRTRIAFAFFVGPYVLLGSYIVAKDGDASVSFDTLAGVALLFGFFAYLAVGLICARIETNSWDQVNACRAEIKRLGAMAERLQPEATSGTTGNKPTAYYAPQKLMWAYGSAYLLMYALFICATVLLTR